MNDSSIEINNQNRLVRIRDVVRLTGFSRAHIYKLSKIHGFPEPLKIGRSTLWVLAEIECWISKKIAERNVNSKEL